VNRIQTAATCGLAILVGAFAGALTVTALAIRGELKVMYPQGRGNSLRKGMLDGYRETLGNLVQGR